MGQETGIAKMLGRLAGGICSKHLYTVVTLAGMLSHSERRLLLLPPGRELRPDCDGGHKKRKGEYLHHFYTPFPTSSLTHGDAASA